MVAFAKEEDFERWRREGRLDILQLIEREHFIWSGDRMVSTEAGSFSRACPFLQSEGERFRCTIYETRPQVCRNYTPGSSEICPRWPKNTGGRT